MASWTCSASASSPHSNCAPLSFSSSDKDLLGGPVFAFVQTDLRNNIAVRPPPPIPRTPPARPFFLLFQTRCISGGSHSVQCSQVRVRNAREPRSGRGAGGRDPGHSLLGPFDPVRAQHRFVSRPHLTELPCLPTNKKKYHKHPLPVTIYLAAYFLHVVHCNMHRKTVMPSFGYASSAPTMSSCATTTRSSFGPLFR